MTIIKVDGLVKEFRRPRRINGRFGALRTLFTQQHTVTRAVDEISFSLNEGELVGYLGPNGAGKSTTIKMLTGILQPTAGELLVSGIVPWRERPRNALNIGVVFGQRTQLWWDLPLRDSLELIGKLYGVETSRHAANTASFTDLLGLQPFLETPVRQLSLGQRMRGDLAAAMIHEPRILYLDEPTIGLDVVAKARIRAFISELNQQRGTTVILTTHDLDDVEQLCRRILLIDEGRVLYDGDVAALKTRYAPHRRLIVHLAEGANWNGIDVAGVDTEKDVPNTPPGQVVLRFDPDTTSVSRVVGAVLDRHHVSDLSFAEPDLEGVVHRIYSSGDRELP
ncbi:ATP-binding cassette domain-containing protein [Streptomyces sp. NPDC102381]|uniref:ABC transporter ATP-binding protein n=1 Tax=Streptomyces sp. NPDC102381 TaxID=3366164 RepID=UPI00380A15E3